MLKNWDQLRFFYYVAKSSSLSKATDILGITQPALSRQISNLEEALNTKLFIRHSRGIDLTEKGEYLFKAVTEMNSKLMFATSHISEDDDLNLGSLTITATPDFGTMYLMHKIKLFNDLYPKLKIKMIFTSEEIDLSLGEADIAFRMYKQINKELEFKFYKNIKRGIYATKAYLQKYGVLEKIDDLINHKIIVLKIDGNINNDYIKMEHFLIEQALQNGIEIENIVEIDSMIAIAKAVENDMGIAVLPCFLENDKLIKILPKIEIPDMPCYFVHHKKYRYPKKMQAVENFLFS
jgi:DNA-binding transcriptional LysR family regulator